MTRSLTFALLLACFALPAAAGECPSVIAEFEAALKTTEADDYTKAQAAKLVEQARQQDSSGRPELCVETVEQALAMMSQ